MWRLGRRNGAPLFQNLPLAGPVRSADDAYLLHPLDDAGGGEALTAGKHA